MKISNDNDTLKAKKVSKEKRDELLNKIMNKYDKAFERLSK